MATNNAVPVTIGVGQRRVRIEADIQKNLRTYRTIMPGYPVTSDGWITSPVIACWPLCDWVAPLDRGRWYLVLTQSNHYYAVLYLAW